MPFRQSLRGDGCLTLAIRTELVRSSSQDVFRIRIDTHAAEMRSTNPVGMKEDEADDLSVSFSFLRFYNL